MAFQIHEVNNPYTAQGTYPRRGGVKLSGTFIVHTTEGDWRAGVMGLTNFLRVRTDYGSYHRAVDWEDIASYFNWEWEAWQDSETNNWAVGVAAACKTVDWGKPYFVANGVEEGIYRNLARCAADFVVYMKTAKGIDVPLKRISGAQARARVPGFCAHGDSGIHRSDPGSNFDWARFFKYTAEALKPSAPVAKPPVVKPPVKKEWYEMAIPANELAAIARNVWAYRGQETRDGWQILRDSEKTVKELIAVQKNLVTAINKVSSGEKFDEAKLLEGIARTVRENAVEVVVQDKREQAK